MWSSPFDLSDHYLIFLEWMAKALAHIYPFKFNRSWLLDDDLLQMVKDVWPSLFPDSSQDDMCRLSHKLRIIKQRVKDWTRTKSLEMNKVSLELYLEIKALLASYPSRILSLEVVGTLQVFRNRKKKLIEHELLSWQLKSRIKWAKLGDANTKLFHSVSLACRNYNTIWALMDEEDTWVEDEDQLKETCIKYFSMIFKDDNKTNILDQLKVI